MAWAVFSSAPVMLTGPFSGRVLLLGQRFLRFDQLFVRLFQLFDHLLEFTNLTLGFLSRNPISRLEPSYKLFILAGNRCQLIVHHFSPMMNGLAPALLPFSF